MILLNIALFAALSLLIKQMYKDTKESLNNEENEYFKDWNKKGQCFYCPLSLFFKS